MQNRYVTNIIPDYSELEIIVRSEKNADMLEVKARVENCARAGALATGCEVILETTSSYRDVRFNAPLGRVFGDFVKHQTDLQWLEPCPTAGSTDMGDVSYETPSVHALFQLDDTDNGRGNHTKGFADAARTVAAHGRTLTASKAACATAFKFLADDEYASQVRDAFTAGQNVQI